MKGLAGSFNLTYEQAKAGLDKFIEEKGGLRALAGLIFMEAMHEGWIREGRHHKGPSSPEPGSFAERAIFVHGVCVLMLMRTIELEKRGW